MTPVRIVEVGSLNLRLRSAQERRRVLQAEAEFFNGLRFHIQRIALPVPLDLDAYLEGLERRGAVAHGFRRQLVQARVDHTDSVIAERQLVQWRNLVVIPKDEHADECVRYVETSLRESGLHVQELPLHEITQVWYAFINPDQAAIDQITQGGVAGHLDRITPRGGLDFRQIGHFRLGNKFARVLCIRAFPHTVSLEVFTDLYRLDRRVTVVQHWHPTPGDILRRDLSNSIGELTTRLRTSMAPFDREVTQVKIRDAQRLLRRFATENEQVLDLSVYLLARADTLPELDEVTRAVQTRLEGKGFKARAPHFWQAEDAFRCCLPAGLNPLREKTRRNVPAMSAPATFPYTNAELNHGSGVVLGPNRATGNLVLWDRWTRLANPHVTVLAMSGYGKSYLLGLILAEDWANGVPIRSLDVDGDRNKRRLWDAFGAQRLRIAPGAKLYMNPMEVRRRNHDEDEDGESGDALLATVQRQLAMFDLMAPDRTPGDRVAAEKLLLELYAEWGIRPGTDHTGRDSQDWPTWTALHAAAEQRPETRRLGDALYSWVHGSLSGMFDRQTSLAVTDQCVVLDVSEVVQNSEARGPVALAVLGYLWDWANEDWQQRKVLELDEFGLVADTREILRFCRMMAKAGRRRSCSLLLATQDPGDYLMGLDEVTRRDAQAVLANCATRILGYLDQKAVEQVTQAIRLTEAEAALLARLPREEKLMICSPRDGYGEQRAHVEVLASDLEHRIITGIERNRQTPSCPA